MEILIAGKDPSSRSALGSLMQIRSNLEVIGEATTVAELYTRIKTGHIDLVLLDGQFSDQNNIEVLAHLKQMEQPPAVLVLSVRPELEAQMKAAGADAFVYKGDDPKKLLIAIEKIRSMDKE